MVSLRAWGGGGEVDYGSASAPSRSGGGGASFDLYVHPWIALGAWLNARGGDGQDLAGTVHHSWGLDGGAGIGVRWDDARIDLSYLLGGDQVDGRWQPLFYGHLRLRGRIVVRRRLEVDLTIDTLDEGASAAFGVEGFVGRRLGVYAGVGGGGAHPGARIPYRSATAWLGVAPWRSRHFGVNLSYRLSWSNGTEDGVLTHLFSLTLRSRAR